jgi:hypothetical protein
MAFNIGYVVHSIAFRPWPQSRTELRMFTGQELTQMIHSHVSSSGDRVVFFVDEAKFTACSHPLTLSRNHCRVCEGTPRSKGCAVDRRTQAQKARSRSAALE